MICENGDIPIWIHQLAVVSIPSGCKLPLQDYILYAEQEEYLDIDPHLVHLNFKEMPVFKLDLAHLDEAIGLLRNHLINRFKVSELLNTVEKIVQSTLDYNPINWAVPTLLCLLFAAIGFCIYYFRLCPRFCRCGKHHKHPCERRNNFITNTDLSQEPSVKRRCDQHCQELKTIPCCIPS